MLSSMVWDDCDVARLKADLLALNREIPPQVRSTISAAVKRSADGPGDELWDELERSPRLQAVFKSRQAIDRYRTSLARWMAELFPPENIDLEAFIARQTHFGTFEASMQVPLSFIARSMHLVRKFVCRELFNTRIPQEHYSSSVVYISTVMDISGAAIISGYSNEMQRSARADEALREISIGIDLRAEREKQKAALAEWAQSVFYETAISKNRGDALLLSRSEFGLWFSHRAHLLFGRKLEYASTATLIDRADQLVRQLNDCKVDMLRHECLKDIRQVSDQINNLMIAQFSRYLDLGETGDPLSRLLNRRFLKAAVQREMAAHRRTGRTFSLIMFEIPHFANLRSRVGEAGADTIVQQTAAILLNAVRTSDVVISMGRETFLVIRVEAELQEATSFAQRIADSYRVSHFTVDGQTIQENTLKFGVAVYDGSSDSRRLVDQVASALRGYNEAV